MRLLEQVSLPGKLRQCLTVGGVADRSRDVVSLFEQLRHLTPDLIGIHGVSRLVGRRGGSGAGYRAGSGQRLVHRLPRLVDC